MTFYNQKIYFHNTIVDYIIFVAALVTLTYSMVTLEVVYTGDPDIAEQFRSDTDYYEYRLNVQLILAPIVLVHRMFIMLAAECKIKRLNQRYIGLRYRVKKYRVIETIKKEYGSLLKRRKKYGRKN